MLDQESDTPAVSKSNSRQQTVVRSYISESDLLKTLSPENQGALARVSRIQQVESGGYVFAQGDNATGFYVLCRGSVKIYRTSPEGREVVVKILQPGEIFGEVMLFKNIPYPASAVCVSDSAMIEIDRKHLLDMLTDADFRLDFVRILMEKLQYLNQRVYMLGALDVEERFFYHIISNYGVRDEYDLDLSKKDLASTIGTTPETLSRLLNRLKARGTLTETKKRFTIDRHTIEYFAEDLGQAEFNPAK